MDKTDFQGKVYALTRRVPRGKVATYGAIARALGTALASRAVGNALNKNPGIYPVNGGGAKITPCHRIVRSNGEVGGYATGTAKKIALLRKEGVIIKNGRVDLMVSSYSF